MFPFLWLLLSIFAILKDSRNMWWVYLVTSMWINPDVRIGSISLLSALHLFIILNAIVLYKRNKNLHPSLVGSSLKILIIYIVLVNVLFLPLHTGPLIDNLLVVKGNFVLWPFLFSLLFYPAGRKSDFLIVGISLFVLCFYGIYCYVSTQNPYMEFLSAYMSEDTKIVDLIERSMNDQRGMLSGRITGTSLYTIQYGILMTLFVFFIMGNMKTKGSLIQIVLLLFVFFNIYLTGSRGPLFATIVGMLLFYSHTIDLRKKLFFSCVLVLSYFLFESFFNMYVGSLIQNDVGGSTTEGRTLQFYGAFMEVSDSFQSILFGKGPYFIPNYLNNYGPHPLALAFESIHVSGIVTYGILGLILNFLGSEIMMYRVVRDLKNNKILNHSMYYLLISLIITNFIYCIMVGNVYDYLYKFIFIMFIIANIRSEFCLTPQNSRSIKNG